MAKITSGLFSLISLLTLTVTAQNQVAPVINKVTGQPMTITYADGRAAMIMTKDIYSPLSTRINLSENSCQPIMGNECNLEVPLINRILFATWVKHPDSNKIGKFVEKPTAFVTDSNTGATKVTKSEVISANSLLFLNEKKSKTFKNAMAGLNKTLGENGKGEVYASTVTCKSEVQGLIPRSPIIHYWTENFETNNDEVGLSSTQNGSVVNQMYKRLKGIKIKALKNKIYTGVPESSFGIFADLIPMGIAYQIQWTFKANNIVDAKDEYCQMKWDVDFTAIFTQFQKIQAEKDQVKQTNLQASDMKEKIKPLTFVDEKDSFSDIQYFFDMQQWKDAI